MATHEAATTPLPSSTAGSNADEAPAATGDFRLCYKNAAGLPVPCANVRYQVVHATGDIVAKGSTGQDGRTQRISVKATQATTTPGFSSPYPLFTTMHDGMERYTLQVWSQVLSAYVEPELHPDLKMAPRLVLPSVSVIAPPMQTQDVLLKRYLRVRFQFKQGNQPIVGAPLSPTPTMPPAGRSPPGICKASRSRAIPISTAIPASSIPTTRPGSCSTCLARRKWRIPPMRSSRA